MFAPWELRHKAYLVSTCTGGQWPQVRHATCKEWTTDAMCQLCKTEVGTLLHRRFCSATMPHGGWPLPHKSAASFDSLLGAGRKQVALTMGLLFARIVVRPAPVEDCFKWFLHPPEQLPKGATWYIDGSLLHPRFRTASRAGFGVVVVGLDGSLIAYGLGNPPSWITDAAGAEAWGFFYVVNANLICPRIVTDCFNILVMLSQGAAQASAANRPLARVSNLIFNALDEQESNMLANTSVVWMPAHCTTAAIGNRLKSNGSYVTALDWRANRLVDRLAKLAAQEHCVPDAGVRLAVSAACAAEYYAASVGTINYAANNHSASVVGEDGRLRQVTLRDSVSAQFCRKTRKRDASNATSLDHPLPPDVVQPATCSVSAGVLSSRVPSHSALLLASKRKAAADHALACETSFWSSWKERVDKRPALTQPAVCASDRMQAIKRLMLERSS